MNCFLPACLARIFSTKDRSLRCSSHCLTGVRRSSAVVTRNDINNNNDYINNTNNIITIKFTPLLLNINELEKW